MSTVTQANYTLPPSMQEKWMTGPEALRELSFSRWTLARKIQSGVIESSHYNKRLVISRASVKRYLAQWG